MRRLYAMCEKGYILLFIQKIQSSVTIVGMDQQLNGRTGMVQFWNEDTLRFAVALDDYSPINHNTNGGSRKKEKKEKYKKGKNKQFKGKEGKERKEGRVEYLQVRNKELKSHNTFDCTVRPVSTIGNH